MLMAQSDLTLQPREGVYTWSIFADWFSARIFNLLGARASNELARKLVGAVGLEPTVNRL